MNDTTPIVATRLSRMASRIHGELRRLALTDTCSTQEALQRVFRDLYGADRPREEELGFLMVAAPLARRIAISLARHDERLADTDVSVLDVREWIGWLDTVDPVCAHMIDLHYFAGVTARETAHLLRRSPKAVLRELRFAKSWLHARLL